MWIGNELDGLVVVKDEGAVRPVWLLFGNYERRHSLVSTAFPSISLHSLDPDFLGRSMHFGAPLYFIGTVIFSQYPGPQNSMNCTIIELNEEIADDRCVGISRQRQSPRSVAYRPNGLENGNGSQLKLANEEGTFHLAHYASSILTFYCAT